MRTRIAVIVLSLGIMFCGTSCIGPGHGIFAPNDAVGRAVLALDVRYLSDAMRGEAFDVSSLNAVSLDKFTDRRIERAANGKLTTLYVLVAPGRYDVTLRYCRNAMYFAGRDFWLADVTKEVVLEPGIYTVGGKVEGDFVYLWLADSAGHQVTQPEKALIKKNERRIPILVPVPIG